MVANPHRRFAFSLFQLAWSLSLFLALTPQNLPAGDPIYRGACDGSAAVALDADHFIGASDEDNLLRIYQRGSGGMPEQVFNVSSQIQADPRHPESDLEGAARLGDTIYWISSHSLSRSGKERSGRGRFFATRCLPAETGWKLELVGSARADLLDFLTTDPGLASLKLAEAATRAPKEKDALNIEGLGATPDGQLLIGFRNPIRGGKAVLVPLRNPREFVSGAAPQFGAPIKLNLGGLGIRDLAAWQGGCLVAAGPAHGGGKHELWFWAGGKAAPQRLLDLDTDALDVEAIVPYPGVADSVELLSDDSGDVIGGRECSKLPVAERRFRSRTVVIPGDLAGAPPASVQKP